MATIKLYSYWRSSASWRVRIALALKDLKYEYLAVHLAKNQQFEDDYAHINKMSQLPTIFIDELKLTQSLPIMEFLDEKYPDRGTKLLPVDIKDRAIVRQMCEIVNSGIQPLQNLSVIRKVENQQEWACHWITKGFTGLEALLEAHAGTYCFGNNITMADACLVPQLYGAQRFKVDMSQFPIISRICATLENHPAFVAADPFRQPDCPENEKK